MGEKYLYGNNYSSLELQTVISRYKYCCLQNDQHNRTFAIFLHLEPKIISFKGISILLDLKGALRLKNRFNQTRERKKLLTTL